MNAKDYCCTSNLSSGRNVGIAKSRVCEDSHIALIDACDYDTCTG